MKTCITSGTAISIGDTSRQSWAHTGTTCDSLSSVLRLSAIRDYPLCKKVRIAALLYLLIKLQQRGAYCSSEALLRLGSLGLLHREQAVSSVATRRVVTGVPLSEQLAFYQEDALLPTVDFDLK